MKALRRLLWLVGAVILLLLLAGVFAPFVVDGPWLKGEIARVVQERKQRNLRIDGDIRLSLWPLGLRIGETRLSEPRSDREFAAFSEAVFAVRIMPLLSKQVVVDNVEVRGLRMQVMRAPDGRFNFADLLESEPPKGDVVFDVGKVTVAGEVNYYDVASGASHRGDNIQVQVGRLARGANGRFEFVGRYAAAAPISVSVRGAYALTESGAVISSVAGSAKSGNGLGEFAVQDISLAPAALLVRNVQLDVRLAAGGARGVAVKVALQELRIADGQVTSQPFDARVEWSDGQRRVAGALSLGAIDGNLADHLSVKMKGNLELEDQAIPAKIIDVRLTGHGRFSQVKGSAVGELQAETGESRLTANWDVDLRAKPAALSFTAYIDRLRLDDYLPAGSVENADQPSAKSGANEAPPVEIAGKLRIGELWIQDAAIRDFRVDFKFP